MHWARDPFDTLRAILQLNFAVRSRHLMKLPIDSPLLTKIVDSVFAAMADVHTESKKWAWLCSVMIGPPNLKRTLRRCYEYRDMTAETLRYLDNFIRCTAELAALPLTEQSQVFQITSKCPMSCLGCELGVPFRLQKCCTTDLLEVV